jgi:hypothetical protein
MFTVRKKPLRIALPIGYKLISSYMPLSVEKQFVLAVAAIAFLSAGSAWGQALFQPPGANLTYGDVTHGMRAQSASTNPAAAAADMARLDGNARSGTVISGAAGIEFGNIQELWDFYDEVSGAYKPSDGGVQLPGQLPETKPPGGIDLGDIWDSLDPDIQDELRAVADEVARQAAILALISVEGYGKAWLAADAPFVFSQPRWGGAWTMQLKWSGTSRAFGIVETIEFDEEEARAAIQGWFDTELANRPTTLQVGGQVFLVLDALGNVAFSLQNDSAIAFKATQTTSLSSGYSRAAWSNDAGTLFIGGEAHLHNMRLSGLGVRFGDITDSEELFDQIRNADYESDTRISFDAGVLWVAENYQLGAQLTNLNEPDFQFPDIDTDPFTNENIIQQFEQGLTYTMERQLKLEASLYGRDRKWSWHVGLDANAASDPVGDEFQWLTLSGGLDTGKAWLPNLRIGYRQNLAGTEKSYASLGMTMFKYVNIDIASALSATKIDGRRLPEGLMLSIGFQINW